MRKKIISFSIFSVLIFIFVIFYKGIDKSGFYEPKSEIKDIPKFITSKDFPKEIDIRGEVFIKNSDFKKIKDNFANPRNAASGSLRQKNPSDTKKIPLKFIAYTFGFISEDKFEILSIRVFRKKHIPVI